MINNLNMSFITSNCYCSSLCWRSGSSWFSCSWSVFYSSRLLNVLRNHFESLSFNLRLVDNFLVDRIYSFFCDNSWFIHHSLGVNFWSHVDVLGLVVKCTGWDSVSSVKVSGWWTSSSNECGGGSSVVINDFDSHCW